MSLFIKRNCRHLASAAGDIVNMIYAFKRHSLMLFRVDPSTSRYLLIFSESQKYLSHFNELKAKLQQTALSCDLFPVLHPDQLQSSSVASKIYRSNYQPQDF